MIDAAITSCSPVAIQILRPVASTMREAGLRSNPAQTFSYMGSFASSVELFVQLVTVPLAA